MSCDYITTILTHKIDYSFTSFLIFINEGKSIINLSSES